MKNKLIVQVIAVLVVSGVRAEGMAPVIGAIGETKPIFDARLRMESVDQTPLAEESDADTLRLRLGFETGKAWNTSLLAEGEAVWPIAGEYRGDNARATHLTHPIVADPETTEINRLALTNTSLPGTTVTLGRQRIVLDDHRFVGNVGWRQNEQTYDALRVVNRTVPQLTIDATYLDQVNRIYGPDSPQGRYAGDGVLGNVAYQFPVGKLTGFAYVLDFDALTRFPGLTTAQAAPLNPLRASTETYGVRFAGDRPLSRVKLAYLASYATQSEYGDNPFTFDLDYYLLELTASYRQYGVTVGQEVLEGNGTLGFATPLATLHRFNGWADKFLTTPANGIDDRYVGLGYSMKGVSVFDTVAASVFYREYESERLGIDLGTEVNLQLQAKYQRFVGLLKYARYEAAEGKTPAAYQDTTKWWLQLEYVW